MVGASGGDTVRHVSLAVHECSKENSKLAGIGFVEIKSAEKSPFDQDGTRTSRAAELILAHQVTNIDEIARCMADADAHIVAPLGLSDSGKSRSMAVLDPNGVRVELYEY